MPVRAAGPRTLKSQSRIDPIAPFEGIQHGLQGVPGELLFFYLLQRRRKLLPRVFFSTAGVQVVVDVEAGRLDHRFENVTRDRPAPFALFICPLGQERSGGRRNSFWLDVWHDATLPDHFWLVRSGSSSCLSFPSPTRILFYPH